MVFVYVNAENNILQIKLCIYLNFVLLEIMKCNLHVSPYIKLLWAQGTVGHSLTTCFLIDLYLSLQIVCLLAMAVGLVSAQVDSGFGGPSNNNLGGIQLADPNNPDDGFDGPVDPDNGFNGPLDSNFGGPNGR